MQWTEAVRSLLTRVASMLSARRLDRELDEELRAHIDHAVEENLRRGMTPRAARTEALRSFGGVAQHKERYRRQRGLPWFETVVQDMRYALRQLRRSPGFTATAVLTIAIGIGVNTAIFSVVNGLLFSSLHIRQKNQIVELGFEQKGASWQSSFSFPEYRDLRGLSGTAFSDLIAEQLALDGISMQGHRPDRALTDYVSGNYFQALGIEPMLGRFFLPSEGETPGADPIAVLSYSYWKQHFSSDPGIVGRSISLDGHPVTVVGVVPPSFRGMSPLFAVQAYLPLTMIATVENTPSPEWSKRTHRDMRIFARLQLGVTRQQADATLAVLARRFALDHPVEEKDLALSTFPLYLGRFGDLDSQHATDLACTFFFGLAGLVLLLACVNVANLLLARASVREREMVIRSALGAQRSRLMRQMLTESLLLALFGGVAGIGMGVAASALLGSINLQTDLPFRLDFGFDWHVLVFSAAIALLAGAVVGIVPAIRLSRANLNLLLREGGRGVTGGRSRFRDALVVLQVGSALLLLVVAGLFTRSLTQAEHIDFGFNPAHVLTLTVDPSEVGYSGPQTRDFYKAVLQRIRSLPGVESATSAQSIPMSLIDNSSDTVTIDGYQPPPGDPKPAFGYNMVATDYFQTMQIPLVEGRSFTEADNENSLRVTIISQSMAKKYWPKGSPIGAHFTMSTDPTHPLQVIGVARDARYEEIIGAIGPYFYLPFLQHYAQNSMQAIELRTSGDPSAIIPEVERVIHAMTPALPIFEVKTLHQSLYSPNGLLIFQVAAALAGVMGTLGLILATVGVYGVLSYVASQKTSELGIRIALGAQRTDILKIVYTRGMWIVGAGLALGLAAAFAAAHLLRSMIVVSATDPATYLGVSAILTVVALLACYIPARRAMHIDPMQALRAE